MRIDLKEDVVNLTDFARNTKQHAKELAEGWRARILTQNGKASVVVLSLDAFEQMAHDAEEYRMDLRLRAALDNYVAGESGAPAKTVMADSASGPTNDGSPSDGLRVAAVIRGGALC